MPDPRQPETGLNDGDPPPNRLPEADIQPADTGSSAGQGPDGQPRGTATNAAMKQEHKTSHEAGEGR